MTKLSTNSGLMYGCVCVCAWDGTPLLKGPDNTVNKAFIKVLLLQVISIAAVILVFPTIFFKVS